MRAVRWIKLDVSMACRTTRRWLPLWAGGDLHGEAKARLEAHLAICPECHRESVSLARALQVLELAASAPRAAIEPRCSPWSMPSRPTSSPTSKSSTTRSSASEPPRMPGLGLQMGLLGGLAALVLMAVSLGTPDEAVRASRPSARPSAPLVSQAADRPMLADGGEAPTFDPSRVAARPELPSSVATSTLEASLTPSPTTRGEDAPTEAKSTY
mgnify:CR=1 FL=1